MQHEVSTSMTDMWRAVKLMAAKSERGDQELKSVLEDVRALRGRVGGGTPTVDSSTPCASRQSSCGECVAMDSCVWCKIEQKCYSGDELGPLHGQCQLFQRSTCGA